MAGPASGRGASLACGRAWDSSLQEVGRNRGCNWQRVSWASAVVSGLFYSPGMRARRESLRFAMGARGGVCLVRELTKASLLVRGVRKPHRRSFTSWFLTLFCSVLSTTLQVKASDFSRSASLNIGSLLVKTLQVGKKGQRWWVTCQGS